MRPPTPPYFFWGGKKSREESVRLMMVMGILDFGVMTKLFGTGSRRTGFGAGFFLRTRFPAIVIRVRRILCRLKAGVALGRKREAEIPCVSSASEAGPSFLDGSFMVFVLAMNAQFCPTTLAPPGLGSCFVSLDVTDLTSRNALLGH